MQFFGLVNNLLKADASSSRKRLQIRRYAVIPIALNVGLLGYVLESDSMEALIRDHRKAHLDRVDSQALTTQTSLDMKIIEGLPRGSDGKVVESAQFHAILKEHCLINKMNPNYDTLPVSEKVKIFKYVVENTSGHDLYHAYWMKSTSSQHWLERRENYTRSLAVNSMVGYILGLGDRHPSNILFERQSGMIVHIDFGDCFEVAMRRENYAEMVPFRLTRMLENALEAGGIHGGFQVNSEISMRVLRENRESLMAVLEALVYDPLVSWRLVGTEKDKRDNGGKPFNLTDSSLVC